MGIWLTPSIVIIFFFGNSFFHITVNRFLAINNKWRISNYSSESIKLEDNCGPSRDRLEGGPPQTGDPADDNLIVRTKDGSTVRYGTLVRYGTPRFLLRGTVRFFCNGTGTVRRYGTLVCNGTGTVRWYAV